MKQLMYCFLFVFGVSVGFASCTKVVVVPSHSHKTAKKVPPGQAKKIYGTKSAKVFAPGQAKKPTVIIVQPKHGHHGNNGKGHGNGKK